DSNALRTDVSVAGSPDPLQTVGGAWTGVYTLGVTHAKHHVTVTGPPVVITAIRSAAPTTNFASINGFQIVKVNPAGVTPFCEPGVGGVMACACGNPNGPGRNCANTGSTGASIASTGTPNLAGDATDPG